MNTEQMQSKYSAWQGVQRCAECVSVQKGAKVWLCTEIENAEQIRCFARCAKCASVQESAQKCVWQ